MKTKWQRQMLPWVPMLCLLLLSAPAHAFYNPQAGRWLNRDPIEEIVLEHARFGEYEHMQADESLPDKVFASSTILNAYAFVYNTPLQHIDPYGLKHVVIMQVGDVKVGSCPACPPQKCCVFHSPAGRGGSKLFSCCGGNDITITTGHKSRAEARDETTGHLERVGPNTFACFCETKGGVGAGRGGICAGSPE